MVGRRDLLKRGAAAAAVVAGAGLNVASGAPAEINRQQRQPVRNRAVLLVDRSGSMFTVQDQTIKGINAFISEQRNKPDLFLSLLQFDNSQQGELTLTESFMDVAAPDVTLLTDADYQPRGGTPLYRAVVATISRMEANSGPNDKNLLVIQTDGGDTEHGSEINQEIVANLIKAKEAEGNWTFAFMGAEIEAWGQSEALVSQIGQGSTLGYSYAGTAAAWAMNTAATTTWYQSPDISSKAFYTGATSAADLTIVLNQPDP